MNEISKIPTSHNRNLYHLRKYFPLLKEAVVRFLIAAMKYTEWSISAVPGRLYGVEHFCYSELVIESKDFLTDYNIPRLALLKLFLQTKPKQNLFSFSNTLLF